VRTFSCPILRANLFSFLFYFVHSLVEETVCWTFTNSFNRLFVCTIFAWLLLFVAVWTTYLGVSRLDKDRQSRKRREREIRTLVEHSERVPLLATSSIAVAAAAAPTPFSSSPLPYYQEYQSYPAPQPGQQALYPQLPPPGSYSQPPQYVPVPVSVSVAVPVPVTFEVDKQERSRSRGCLFVSLFVLLPIFAVVIGAYVWMLTHGNSTIVVQ
jgi:hypothetical protein